MILYWIIVFLIFSVAGIAHELGHILILLSFRIPIYRLKIGFGPVIWGKNFKNSTITRLRVGMIPFGIGAGFDGDHPRFKSLTFWSKILLFSFGVVTNLVIAILVSFFMGFENVLGPSPRPRDLVDISRVFVVINLMLAMCQLLPFARFDGGRVLNEIVKRYFQDKNDFFVSNLRISITIILTTGIFYIYRLWIP